MTPPGVNEYPQDGRLARLSRGAAGRDVTPGGCIRGEAPLGGAPSSDPGRCIYLDGYPDFPMAQLLGTRRDGGRVTISCLVSDLRFEWRLQPTGAGTTIAVEVEIPEAEAHRLETQREVVHSSMERLATLAAAAA